MSQISKVCSGEVGERWAAALKARYGCAKEVASAFDCEVRTADAWLNGQAPQAKVFVQAWRLHGAAIIAETFAPASDWASTASVDAAITDLDKKIEELGDKITHLRLQKKEGDHG